MKGEPGDKTACTLGAHTHGVMYMYMYNVIYGCTHMRKQTHGREELILGTEEIPLSSIKLIIKE